MNASNSTPKRRETFRRKVIFVGEPQVGKTALIYDLKTGSGINQFVSSYLDGVDIEMNTPTRLPNEENGFFIINPSKDKKYKVKREEEWPPIKLKENDIELSCWDIPAHEDYDRLRPLICQEAHLIVLCAAVDDKGSLRAVRERWLPELTHYLPAVSIILVGCKSDLRHRGSTGQSDEAKEGFTIEEGKTMARQIGARGYIEYNAKTCVYSGALREVLMCYAFETWTLPKPKKRNWFIANILPLVK